MHVIDYLIFGIYFCGVLAVGIYFYFKNESREDYYVGGRSVSASHVGLSIVATDVGGGFSIGLGGLGFVMGLSGSWLLFTGLIGAWLAAALVVPRIKKLDVKLGMLTYPDYLAQAYNKKVAMFAAVISGIGYLGFTAAQILAGAKLAAGSVFSEIAWMSPLEFSLYIMVSVILLYTVLGGLKAVIYTDTIQWIILLSGLAFLGLPIAIYKLGGWQQIISALPPTHFSLTNITAVTLVNWAFTIIPIWFIAMTLYQRIYACRTVQEAKKAFYIAGIFEYPVMAFIGVSLGVLGRIAFPDAEAEMALPMLLKEFLPVGIAGFVLASYFSAVMSTADSCLIASSGNFVNDVFEKTIIHNKPEKYIIRISQVVTLVIGVLALILAASFQSVLDIILNAYGFMVSGLFVPTLIALIWPGFRNSTAALISMVFGGMTTLILTFSGFALPLNLDESIAGILISAIAYILYYNLNNRPSKHV